MLQETEKDNGATISETGLTRTLADSMTVARDMKITDVVSSDLELFSLENDDDIDE